MIIFDQQALAARVRAQRGDRPLRAVAGEITGVSLSTLSRIENGHMPDMDTFLALCDWLETSPVAFFPDAAHLPLAGMDPLTRIELALRADPALDAEFVDALLRVIRLFHARPTSPTG